MPTTKHDPEHFEPAWLERSLDRYYTWGLVFMVILIASFPLYKLREPDLRAEAKAARQQEYMATGATQFATNCASCHGDNGTGGTAPTLNSSQFLTQTTDEQMSLIIAGGISGSDMSAWGLDYGGALTDQQILQIVTYLRSLEADAPSVPDWRRGAKAP
jgi:mono/diheme cytochrome c family protein